MLEIILISYMAIFCFYKLITAIKNRLAFKKLRVGMRCILIKDDQSRVFKIVTIFKTPRILEIQLDASLLLQEGEPLKRYFVPFNLIRTLT